MKRLGALLAAVALVVAAAFANQAIHADDDEPATADPAPRAALEVVCATEFEEACDALAADAAVGKLATFRVEAPGVTADALAVAAPEFDLWLTSEPWPDIAATRAGGDAGLADAGAPLARSPLGLVAEIPRTRAIARTCESTGMSGKCIFGTNGATFDSLGVPGDTTTVKFGLAPITETAGILALAAMADGWFDGTAFDTTDIDIDVDFRSSLSRLAASSVASPKLVDTLLTIPRYRVAVDLNVDHQLARTAAGNRYQVLDLTPAAEAVAVPVSSTTGATAIEVIGRDRLTHAITAVGWSAPADTSPPLPDPAVLDALATRWNAS